MTERDVFGPKQTNKQRSECSRQCISWYKVVAETVRKREIRAETGSGPGPKSWLSQNKVNGLAGPGLISDISKQARNKLLNVIAHRCIRCTSKISPKLLQKLLKNAFFHGKKN